MTRTEARIEGLVQAYAAHRAQIDLFRDQLLQALSSSKELGSQIHSIRSRLKDPEHLRDKLIRKWDDYKSDIHPENLLVKVNDLVGIRVLHLHTRQIREIDSSLQAILHENQYKLIEGPFARTWDDESRSFFRECGIAPQASPSLYTSVHYIVESASRTKITAEIQVRTLMEEVWGEVDHQLNYPTPTTSMACREQLKVLARVTSSASRLVDSIFATHNDQVRSAIIPPVRINPPKRSPKRK